MPCPQLSLAVAREINRAALAVKHKVTASMKHKGAAINAEWHRVTAPEQLGQQVAFPY